MITASSSPLPPAWTEPVAEWADTLHAEGRARATVDGYAKHVGWLAHALAPSAATPAAVTPALLSAWLDQQTWARSTRMRVLVSLRSFYRWATTHGHARRSPLLGVATSPRRPGPARKPLPPAWAEPVAEWVTWMHAGARSRGTIDIRRHYIAALADLLPDPWQATPDDLALYLARDDWAPETKRAARAAVRLFYGWAETQHRIEANPATDLGAVRVRRTVPRPTPDDAVTEALAAGDDRTRLALMLAALAGLRRAEVAGLHCHDVHPTHLRIVGKGGDQRFVPLHADLSAALEQELRRRREGDATPTGWPTVPSPDGWLFPPTDPAEHITPAHMGALIAHALPAGWTAHTLRHRFATQAYAAQRDLRAVQELLGHAKPETTARYAAVPGTALTSAVAGARL